MIINQWNSTYEQSDTSFTMNYIHHGAVNDF